MIREEILILNRIHDMTQHLDLGAIPWVIEVSAAKKQLQQGTVISPTVGTRVVHGLSEIGYLANVFLAKLKSPILPKQSRDRTNPNHTF